MSEISVEELLKDEEAQFQLELLAGRAGLSKKISIPRIQKPGLALAGYFESLHAGRVQILGATELSYLKSLEPADADERLRQLCACDITCLIITKGQDAPPALLEAAEKKGISLLRAQHQSSTFISLLTRFLEEHLLPITSVHGVLVDVLGIGVLLQGQSGIGKSECALDLVLRGHRLVADDVVRVRLKLPAVVFGEGDDLLQHHLEISGLGILNIKHLFGVSAIRDRKKIDLVVNLVNWDQDQEYDRLGLDEQYLTLLGIELPQLCMPVKPGRNIATLVEVAARNQLLKGMGYHSAREFQDRLDRRIAEVALQHTHSIIGDNLE